MNIIAHFFLQPEGTARFAPFEKNQSKEVVDMVLTIIFQVMFMIAFVLTLPNKANLNRISLHYLFPIAAIVWLIGGIYYYFRWSARSEKWHDEMYVKKGIRGFLYTLIAWELEFLNKGTDPTGTDKQRRNHAR